MPVEVAEGIFLQASKAQVPFSVACCVQILNLYLFLPEGEKFYADSASLNI